MNFPYKDYKPDRDLIATVVLEFVSKHVVQFILVSLVYTARTDYLIIGN